MRARLAPGDTVVDAGAHTGYFTVLASRLVGPAGRVVAIESSPVFHRALTRTSRPTGAATSAPSTPPSPTLRGG
ncbi:hypothetical protein ACIBO6_02520 [Streptomyces luteogriseus]|uniref:hypothetical protein n=1 Tax=Streptomyces luteogriseus TaxID=68233 RepID=UPI00379773F0